MRGLFGAENSLLPVKISLFTEIFSLLIFMGIVAEVAAALQLLAQKSSPDAPKS
jgi:hypothetical protein